MKIWTTGKRGQQGRVCTALPACTRRMAGDQAERRPLPVLARQPQRRTHHRPPHRRQRRSLAQQAKLLKAKRDHGEDPRLATPASAVEQKASHKKTVIRSLAAHASPLDAPFEETARAFAANAARGWKRGERERRNFLASIEAYAFPAIGPKRIRDITVDDVLAILRAAQDGARKDEARQHDGKETAKRLRIKIRRVIASAIARSGEMVIDPADAARVHAADSAMKPKRRAVHYRRIERANAPEAFQQVAARFQATGKPVFGAFHRCPQCSATDRGARIALGRNRPHATPMAAQASALKTGKTHVTMLSDQSTLILTRMQAERLSHVVVFPGQLTDKPLAHGTLDHALAASKLGVDVGCPHAWRSLWRDWCSEGRRHRARSRRGTAAAHAQRRRRLLPARDADRTAQGRAAALGRLADRQASGRRGPRRRGRAVARHASDVDARIVRELNAGTARFRACSSR